MTDAAKGCLVGLAVGDALGQPTEGLSRKAIHDRYGVVRGFIGDVTVTDDTEYTLFSARCLLRHGPDATRDDFAADWIEFILPQEPPFKGAGFSEMATIDNLKRGLRPPSSGRHYHSWSDGLAMRVAACAVVHAGDPAGAVAQAREDGLVSHDGEGILAGQAVAAAQAVALTGAPLAEVIRAAVKAVPEDSWTGRNLVKAIALAQASGSLQEAIGPLHDALAITAYPWADLGPEAVGIAFGLLEAGRGDFASSELSAVNLGRDSDTIAAIIGSILGAQQGMSAIPREWQAAAQPARGLCLRVVAGMDLLLVAEELSDLRASA